MKFRAKFSRFVLAERPLAWDFAKFCAKCYGRTHASYIGAIGAVGVFVNLILVGLLKIVFVRQVFLVVFFIAPATGARRAMQMLRRRPGVH